MPSRAALSLCLVGLIACGGDDDDGTSGGAGQLDATKQGFLGDYCRVTLLKDTEVWIWRPLDGNFWQQDTITTLPSGTSMVIESYGSAGYSFTAGGELRRITLPDDFDSFQPGTDISKGCDDSSAERRVFFEAATLHANQDGSGAVCAIAAGEGFAELTFALASQRTTFVGDSIQARCGFSPAHGGDLRTVSLVAK